MMLFFLLYSCLGDTAPEFDPPGASTERASPAEPGAVLTEDGHWYLFSPVPSLAYESPCDGVPPFAQVNVKGALVEGQEVTLRPHHLPRTKRRRLARVIEGGRPAPAHLIEARREVGAAWTQGEGCEAAEGELGCAYATAREAWILAQDDVKRRDDGSLFYVVEKGEPLWPDVCYGTTNWLDALEARGVSPTTVVQAMSPTWTGLLPWRPNVDAHCLLLSGDERQQAEAAAALLELIATEGVGLRNEYDALLELGRLQRLGKTSQDWLAQAEPTSEHGRTCLALEKQLVADGVMELR